APLLVHTRLAIIDTSRAGAQTMTGRGLVSRITYNGEIYNFARIRPRLEAAGHAFDRKTATEGIFRGYATRGSSFLHDPRGDPRFCRSGAACLRSRSGPPARASSSWRATASASSPSTWPVEMAGSSS